MSPMLLWVLLTLAVYRLAELLSVDTIFEPLRRFLGRFALKQRSFGWYLSEWIHCPYCTGVWFAFIAAFALQPVSIWMFLVYWLSIAGGQALLESIGGRNGNS